MHKNKLYQATIDAIDGVEHMDDTSKNLTRWAQNKFGDAGGDVARGFVQAPRTFYEGIKGGIIGANAGFNQLLHDYTPLGLIPGVNDFLRDSAKDGYKYANEKQAQSGVNYYTDIGKDVGAGVSSLGMQSPGVVAAAFTGNPAFMTGYAGGQTGLSSYNEARQSGIDPNTALAYGAGQGAIEAATEYVPAKAFTHLLGAGGGVGKGVARYLVTEQGGEQIATHAGDLLRSAVVDSRSNDNWLGDYKSGRLDAARGAAIGGLVAGVGNPAIGSLAVAARGAKNTNKTGKDLYKETLAAIENSPYVSPSKNAGKVNEFLKNNVIQGNYAGRTDIPLPRQQARQNLKYRQVSPKTQADLRAISKNPNVRKMLNLISHTEGTETHGYNTLVGGGRINDLSKHPNKVGLVTKDGASTAFGRYQIVGKTWRGLQKQYGFTDMQPESQDAAAVALLHQRGALNDVLNGNYKSAINKLGDEWVSLPSSTNKNQGKRSWARVEKFLSGQGAELGNIGQVETLGAGVDDSPINGAKLQDDNSSYGMKDLQDVQADAVRKLAEEQEYQTRRMGRATRVFLDGKMQDATLELADADDLTPSVANTDNQYRDRSRAASQLQITQIANNLEPELLGDSKQIDSGAPTLAADGKTIIGGNGRVMAINQAYNQGNGENYRNYLMENAEQFGLNPDDIQAMNKPVLIRRFNDASIDTNKAAVASNEGGGLSMSALEQARVDSERLPDFGSFVPSDSGELNTTANRGFIREFVGSMPTTVQAQMVGADGQLSQDGVRRLRNAMLYSAYGNSPALSRMVESTDTGMKNMVNAMIQAAPSIAKAKNYIKDGAMHDADISSDIVAAVEKINAIHESGGSVADYLAQHGMFEDELSDAARELVHFFDEHRRSAKAISTLLKNYYELLEQQGNPADGDIFGDAQVPEKQNILKESIRNYEQQNGKQSKQSDIFADGTERQRPVDKSVSEAEQQPESRADNDAGAGEDAGGTGRKQGLSNQLGGENYSRSESESSRPSEEQAEKTSRFERAIVSALGAKNAALIDVVSLHDVSRPDNAADLVNAQGWYDPKTGRITLIADNLPNAETAQFVAWHELGHRKIHVGGWDKWQSLMKQADSNASVKRLADAVMKQRKGYQDKAAANRIFAVEEALAELYAAMQTDNLDGLSAKRYGITLPASFKDGLSGYLSRVAERIRNIIKRSLGIGSDTFSDGQVFNLLKQIDGTDALADLDDSDQDKRFSLSEDAESAFAKAVDAVVEGNVPAGYINMGTTPPVLKLIGMPDGAVRISGGTIEKAVIGSLGRVNAYDKNRHSITPEDMKMLPKQLNNPIAVFESTTKKDAFVVLTELFERENSKDKPVIAALHISKGKRGVDLVDIASVYGRHDKQLEKAFNNNLLYLNKEKGRQFLKTHPLQLHWDITSDADLSARNIKTDADLKQDESKFSRADDDLKDMSKAEKSWFNEMGELQVGLNAYNNLSDVMKPIFEKVGLANGYHKNFTQYMRDYAASTNIAGRTAKQIADIGVTLTKQERELLSDVLEKELPEGVEVLPEIQELAKTIRDILNQQTDDLVALGMLSPDSAERFRDTYLPRIYKNPDLLSGDIAKLQKQFNNALHFGLGKSITGSHLKGRGIFKEVNRGEIDKYEKQGFEIREEYGNKGGKKGKVLMWRDYTKSERRTMGEDRDAMLRFSTGYIKTQADIAKAMLFKRIATDENLAGKTYVEGWKQVPSTEIAGTGGVKRYGALAGMYVHPDVYSALQNQFYVDGVIQRIWRTILNWWKKIKTVYNPVAHINNVISNIVMSLSAGVNPADITAGAIAVKNKNALYQEALEYGLVGEAVDVSGLSDMFTGLNNLSDGQLTDTLITRALRRADKMTLGVAGKLGKVAEKAYRAEDEVFRLALYKKARDNGLSQKEAVDWALTFMFDYAHVPPTVRKLRDSGILPFVSYTYKAIPAMARLALTRPHRVLTVTALMYGVNALSYMLLGEDADEEDERENMPEYQKGFTSFGTPKLIRLPWNDSDGKPMFLDIYRWLPLGDFADTQNQMGGIPLPQWATPNGPVINHAMALMANKDTFTGKEIVKDYQSAGEKAIIYGKWLAQQWLPASVGVPFSYHTNNVLDGLKNQFEGTKFADVLESMSYTGTDSRGDDKQLYRAAWGAFGVKIRGENPQVMRERKERNIAYQIREVQADMRRIARDKSITEKSRESKLTTRREYILELQSKIRRNDDETN